MAVQGSAEITPDEYFYNLRNFDGDKFDSYTVVDTQVSFEKNDWLLTLAARNRPIGASWSNEVRQRRC